MDDKFLYQNLPPVRPGFNENLYARISNSTLKKNTSNKTFKFALRLALASLLLFTVLFTVSEPVRASVVDWIKYIAGFGVQEENELSGLDGAVTIPVDFTGPLAEALKIIPFELSMPTRLPQGYVLFDEVDVSKKDQSLFLRWINPKGGEIVMLVEVERGQGIITGEAAAEEIIINGESVALIRGGYDSNGKWDATKRDVHLYWHKDNLIYILFSSSVSEDELIKIAESID